MHSFSFSLAAASWPPKDFGTCILRPKLCRLLSLAGQRFGQCTIHVFPLSSIDIEIANGIKHEPGADMQKSAHSAVAKVLRNKTPVVVDTGCRPAGF